MNGVMDYNWFGVAFVSDDLPKNIHVSVEKKMVELEEKINEEFDQWLNENGLEMAMGVIVKLGSVK